MKKIIIIAVLCIFVISCKKGASFVGRAPKGFSSVVELRDSDGAPLGRANLMTADSKGNIYVINDQDDNKAFYKYSPDGTIIKKLDGLGKDSKDYKFFFPAALSVGPDDHIYICDIGFYSVQKFALDGKRGVYITGRAKDNTKIFEPQFVTTDKKGTVYVTGPGHTIHRFDPSGQHLGEWGARGSGEGQYSELGSYAIDDDQNLFVLDRDKPRLLKYDSDGKFLKEWKTRDYTHNIVVDGVGKIYVSGAYYVQKFDSEGVLISEVETDEDDPDFRLTSLAGLPSGTLALDGDNSRFLKIE